MGTLQVIVLPRTQPMAFSTSAAARKTQACAPKQSTLRRLTTSAFMQKVTKANTILRFRALQLRSPHTSWCDEACELFECCFVRLPAGFSATSGLKGMASLNAPLQFDFLCFCT